MKYAWFFAAPMLGVCVMLGAADAAWAHAEIAPAEIPAGGTEEFTLEVLQERDVPTTEVKMEIPEGFEVTDVSSTGGWRGSLEGAAVVWSGGQPGMEGSGMDFPFAARAPEEAGEFAFRVFQTYEDGTVVEWVGDENSEEAAAVVEVAAGQPDGGTDEAPHDDEHGSGSEAAEVPDTGGPSPVFLLGACALALAASGTLLARTTRR